MHGCLKLRIRTRKAIRCFYTMVAPLMKDYKTIKIAFVALIVDRTSRSDSNIRQALSTILSYKASIKRKNYILKRISIRNIVLTY